jgi:hypothetical protein
MAITYRQANWDGAVTVTTISKGMNTFVQDLTCSCSQSGYSGAYDQSKITGKQQQSRKEAAESRKEAIVIVKDE